MLSKCLKFQLLVALAQEEGTMNRPGRKYAETWRIRATGPGPPLNWCVPEVDFHESLKCDDQKSLTPRCGDLEMIRRGDCGFKPLASGNLLRHFPEKAFDGKSSWYESWMSLNRPQQGEAWLGIHLLSGQNASVGCILFEQSNWRNGSYATGSVQLERYSEISEWEAVARWESVPMGKEVSLSLLDAILPPQHKKSVTKVHQSQAEHSEIKVWLGRISFMVGFAAFLLALVCIYLSWRNRNRTAALPVEHKTELKMRENVIGASGTQRYRNFVDEEDKATSDPSQAHALQVASPKVVLAPKEIDVVLHP